MHPNHEHATRNAGDPDPALARRLEVGAPERRARGARSSATPSARARSPSGIARVIEPDRALVAGVEIETDLGTWTVYETPGHAPSHVCLFQPERRLLISGDHLLGRISLFYDYGWTPDPVGEFLQLARRRRRARRAALPVGPRPAVRRRPRPHRGQPQARRRAARGGARRARRRAANGRRDRPEVYGEPLTEANAALAAVGDALLPAPPASVAGRVAHEPDGGAERWRLT